jgi:hypothetical protein
MRKVIQGTRSEKGLENHSVLRSLFDDGQAAGQKASALLPGSLHQR